MNPRYSVSSHLDLGAGTSKSILRFENVKPSDQGSYMCQLNTLGSLGQTGFLTVTGTYCSSNNPSGIVRKYLKDQGIFSNMYFFTEPPRFVEDSGQSDITVREGDTVTLPCQAVGSPKPHIDWKREDGNKIVGGMQSKTHTNSTATNYEHHACTFRKLSTAWAKIVLLRLFCRFRFLLMAFAYSIHLSSTACRRKILWYIWLIIVADYISGTCCSERV